MQEFRHEREQAVTDEVVASFAGTPRRPAAARCAEPHPAPARVRPRGPAHRAGVGRPASTSSPASGTSPTTSARSSSCSPTCWACRCSPSAINAPARPAGHRVDRVRAVLRRRRARGAARRRHRARRPGHPVLGDRHRPLDDGDAAAGRADRRVGGRRGRLLRRAVRRATARPGRGWLRAGRRTASTASGRCARRPTRSPTTARSATCSPPPAAARCGLRTCISRSTRRGTAPSITHIFVAGDPYLDRDAVFGVKDSLVVDFAEHPPGTAPDGRVLDTPWAGVHVRHRAGAPWKEPRQ